jgi:hypothetical protein
VLLNANTALECEHSTSGYNDEDNTYTDTPTPFVHYEQDPYEVHGPHNSATSLEHDGLFNAGTLLLELDDPP